MNLPTKTIPIPTPENVTVDGPTLRKLAEHVTATESQLRTRTEAVVDRLRGTAPSLEAEVVNMRVLGLQHPGAELQRLSHHAEVCVQGSLGLAEEVRTARERLAAAGQVMERVQARLATLDITDIKALEYQQEMSTGLWPVRRVCRSLDEAVVKAEGLIGLARLCAGRTAQAACLAAREHLVATRTAQLVALRGRLDTLRAPDPHESRLAALVGQVARALEADLPVPGIVWPDPEDDPFTPPVLEEV